MKHFVILPSGVVIDVCGIVYFGKINEIKEKRKRKPEAWLLSIQFDYTTDPITLSYGDKDSAMEDYNALRTECKFVTKFQKP